MEVSQDPSGAQQDDSSLVDENQKKDTVDYSTYQKTLAQEKAAKEKARNAMSELEQLKAELAQQKEQKLKEQNEYKALYESTVQTVEQLKKEKDDFLNQKLTATRMNAFEKVAGKLKNDDYFRLLPIDEIIVEDDGNINMDSVELVARKTKERYPDIFEAKPVGKLPSATGSMPSTEKDYSKVSRAEFSNDLALNLKNIIGRR